MNARLRQALSAFGVAFVVALAFGLAGWTALSIYDAHENIDSLKEQSAALEARERRASRLTGLVRDASPLIEAKSVTLAGAALQQRLEASIASARGRLVSFKLDVAPRGDERQVVLAVELAIAEPDLQTLLFDLETGHPYIFVEAVEARAPEATQQDAAMRVSLRVSGQWSGAK